MPWLTELQPALFLELGKARLKVKNAFFHRLYSFPVLGKNRKLDLALKFASVSFSLFDFQFTLALTKPVSFLRGA